MRTRSKRKKKITKKKIILIVALWILLLGFVIFIGCIILTPKLYLKGKDISIEVGNDFVEPGYKSYVLNKDISNRVSIKNNLNTNKIGSYNIEYEVKFLIFDVKKVRKIRVVDKSKPVISLSGNEEVFLCPNKSYAEEGYNAYDNYDGDITKRVERIEEDDKIVYKVVDSFGNVSIRKRKVIKKDNDDPVVKLNGYNNMTIYLGNKYKEPGYSAIDNCDGDITKKVEITGRVNTNQVGVYTLNYKAVDTFGNETIVSRVINVVDIVNINRGVIYLTFDDGPSRSITGKILDILKEENVKATFFVINKDNTLNYLIKREYDEGHTVGLHSYSHNYQTIYSNNNAYIDDLIKINTKVKGIIGVDSKIIRFPGGSSNTISKKYTVGVMSYLAREVSNRGYKYFDWNISSEDAGGVQSSEEIYNNVVNNLSHSRSNVVLMHDFENNYYTLNSLRKIIHYGKNNGYNFSKITMNTPQVVHRIFN